MIAAGLAADGWDLVLSFWRRYDQRVGLEGGSDDPERLADELRGRGCSVELVPADLEDPTATAALVQEASARSLPRSRVNCLPTAARWSR